MPSKAQQIREALIVEIRKVAGIGDTGPDWRLWEQVTRFPAVFLILDREDKERSPTRSKEGQLHFRAVTVLSTAAQQDDFDTLRAAIEAEIEDDPGLSDLALDAWVSGCGPFATAKSISGDVYVRDVFIEVIYRHDRGAP